MNKKIAIQFTSLTFALMLIFWGGLVILGWFGITIDEYPVLYVPQIIGAWTPAIASFAVLKKNKVVSGIKEWLKNIFTVKSSIYNYLFIIALLVIFIVLLIVTSGLNRVEPLYMFFIWILASVVAGAGMEEAGWRYILYPALNRKFNFVISSLIMSPIHVLWHVPLWFSMENGPLGIRSFWSAIFIFGLSFTINAIYKISKGNVFLCLLFHCMINAGPSTFIVNQTIHGAIITSLLMVIISIAAVSIYSYAQRRNT